MVWMLIAFAGQDLGQNYTAQVAELEVHEVPREESGYDMGVKSLGLTIGRESQDAEDGIFGH